MIKIRDGLPVDLEVVIPFTQWLTGMPREALDELVDFYLSDHGMPMYWRVADDAEVVSERLRKLKLRPDQVSPLVGTLAGIVTERFPERIAFIVSMYVWDDASPWTAVLLYREFERWAKRQGATEIVCSAPVPQLVHNLVEGGPGRVEVTPQEIFLKAAKFKDAGPVDVGRWKEKWMRKELPCHPQPE